jgi:hypothetical protein
MPIIVMTGPDTFKVAQYGDNPADPVVRISPEEYLEGLASSFYYDPPLKPGEKPEAQPVWRPVAQSEWRPAAQFVARPPAQPVTRTTSVAKAAPENDRFDAYTVYTKLDDRPVPPAPYFSVDVSKTGVETSTRAPAKAESVKYPGTQWYASKDELPPVKKPQTYFLDVDMRPTEEGVYPAPAPFNPVTGLPYERESEPAYASRLRQPIRMAGTQWHSSKDELPPSKKKGALDVDLRPSESIYVEVQGAPINPATGLPLERVEEPTYTKRLVQPVEMAGTQWYASKDETMPVRPEHGVKWPEGRRTQTVALVADPVPTAPFGPEFPETIYSGTPWIMPGTEWHPSKDELPPRYRLNVDLRPSEQVYPEPEPFNPATGLPYEQAEPTYTSRLFYPDAIVREYPGSLPTIPPNAMYAALPFRTPLPEWEVNPATGLPYQRESLERLHVAPELSVGLPESLPEEYVSPLDELWPEQPAEELTDNWRQLERSQMEVRVPWPDQDFRFLPQRNNQIPDMYFPLVTSYTPKPVMRGTSSKQEHAKAQREGMHYDPETRTWKAPKATTTVSPTYDSYSPWWQYYFATHEPFIVP